jgi:hypothetical protein
VLDARDAHQPRPDRVRRALGVGDAHPEAGHCADVLLDPRGVGRTGHRDRSVLRGELGLAGPADHDLHVAIVAADEHEAGQLPQPALDQRIEHLVEAGALVDRLPEPGDAGLGGGRQQDDDVVAEDAVPVPGHHGAGHGHDRAPSFSC